MTAGIDLRVDGWTHVGNAAARGRAFDGDEYLDARAVAERIREAVQGTEPLSSAAEVAADLEGFYAAVVSTPDATYLVTDAARSIPLYYADDGSIVSDRGRVVRDSVDASRDPVAESEFLLTRYVPGPETIWAGVASTQPGEIVRLDDDGVTRRQYWEYCPGVRTDSPEDSLTMLREGFETALERLECVADGRPVVVPLSGGLDSRLLAAGLAARNHEVVGFTFGRSGHPDVEVSREVADRLGIRWEFVPYSAAAWYEWYHGEACERYRTRAFGGDALPFLAEWPAVRRLLDERRVPDDALFCPGHTVATPSERLPVFAGEPGEPGGEEQAGCGPADDTDRRAVEPTVEALVDYVLERHYTLWEWDDETFESAARERIRRGLLGDRLPDAITGPETAAAAYERWEWTGRMTTFTNGDLRVYEDAGLEWWLPLWDPAYVRAWERVPLAERRNKQLHAELAAEYYRLAGDVPPERADLTDRSLSPIDRHLALVRHTPVRQFTERDGEWDPPFLAPRSAWNTPGNHPLGWDGAVAPEILEALPESRGFYSLRTLAATGRLDFADPEQPIRTGDLVATLKR